MTNYDFFVQVKKFYGKGLYTKDQVHSFVDKGKITEEQYVEIVGQGDLNSIRNSVLDEYFKGGN